MKDPIEGFISAEDRKRIEEAVARAEKQTSGEIVVMVVPESGRYPMAAVTGALAFSFPVSVLFARIVGGLFWAGAGDMWLFVGGFAPLFVLFHSAVTHLPFLKRLFVRRQDMEDEVEEGAQVNFFKRGLYRTRDENGVLIYVSMFERMVWILGDRGVNAVIPGSFWKEAVDIIVKAIKEGRPADGICEAVNQVGKVLREKFPMRPGDENELADVIVGAD